MPGRHVNNQALALPTGHSLERFGHPLVVTTGNERRPDLFHELNELVLTQLTPFELFELRKLSFQHPLVRLRQRREDFKDVREGHVVYVQGHYFDLLRFLFLFGFYICGFYSIHSFLLAGPLKRSLPNRTEVGVQVVQWEHVRHLCVHQAFYAFFNRGFQ